MKRIYQNHQTIEDLFSFLKLRKVMGSCSSIEVEYQPLPLTPSSIPVQNYNTYIPEDDFPELDFIPDPIS